MTTVIVDHDCKRTERSPGDTSYDQRDGLHWIWWGILTEFYIQYVPRSVNQLLADDDTANPMSSWLIKPASPPMTHAPELGGLARFDPKKGQA